MVRDRLKQKGYIMAQLNANGRGIATAQPELRKVGDSGFDLCTVTLAFNKSYKPKGSDKWEQETCFLKVQTWGNKAVKMAELVKKGDLVQVEGALKQESWNDDSGNKRISYSLNCSDFQVCLKTTKTGEKTSKQEQHNQPSEDSADSGNDNMPF